MYMCDMTHLYMRHDSYICATWLEKIECVRATWLQKTNDMTHVYVRHDAFICATWLEKILYTCSTWLNKKRTLLIYMCDLTRTSARSACSNSIRLLYEGVTKYCNTNSQKRHAIPQKRPTITNQQRALQFCEIWWLYLSDGCMKESKKNWSWLIQMWDMTHSYMQQESYPTFKWVMSNIFLSDGYMKESKQFCEIWWLYLFDGYMEESKKIGHDSFTCGTWLIHMCNMTHVPHFAHMNESCCTYKWVMSHIWMSHVHFFSFKCARWLMSYI